MCSWVHALREGNVQNNGLRYQIKANLCVCVCQYVVLPLLTGLPGWTCMATLASSGRVAPIIAGLRCRPVLPLHQCDMHLGENLSHYPRTTLEVGW